jgi:hypothetical protein
MSPPPVPPGNAGDAKGLQSSKAGAEKDFSSKKTAGKATEQCPPCKERWLKVAWTTAEVYCADTATLSGQAAGIESEVVGQGQVTVSDSGVGSPSAPGQSSFSLQWKASGVDFTAQPPATSLPPKLPAVGNLSADGMSATTPKALVVKRLPDQPFSKVTIACKSPKKVNGTNDYEWTAAFQLGVKDAKIKLKQTLQIKKGWLGKWVSFDPAKDKLAQTFGFVKKDGATWKYWDTGAAGWKALPRAASDYTMTNMVFVDAGGGKFVGRDQPKFTWPESFAQPTDYEKMKKAWLKNIHDVWSRKFLVKHKHCTGVGLCQWDIDIDVHWSDNAGDKLVYAIWAAEWERSNASDWFLTEDRLGVAGHECGHLLAAYDEYTGGAIHPGTKKIEEDSIMGQNLTTAKTRHLADLRKEIRKKIKGWIGRDWELEIKRR